MSGGKWVKNKIVPFFKIFFIFITSIFLPKIFLLYTAPIKQEYISSVNEFKYGLENIPPLLAKTLQNPQIGLITNQTGKDQYGKKNIDILQEKDLNIVKIFAPEHGLNGNIAAGKDVKNGIDKNTDIPIISLYDGENLKSVDPQKCLDIDTFIFDIQDSGMRHYTYISTLYKILEFASQHDKRVIVLDRPNPLGKIMEGPLVEEDLKSFISIAPIPLRHGMTIGELAQYFNKKLLPKQASLLVIPMKNYQRDYGLLGKDFIMLSPNITSIESCYGYSFLGILGEVKPFNIAVGTKDAFQCILLPENLTLLPKKWNELKEILSKCGIESSNFAYTNTKDNQHYQGLKINIRNINEFSSIKTLMKVLDFFKQNGIQLTFSSSFDKAIGTKLFREYFEGKTDKLNLLNQIDEELVRFYKKAQDCLIYKPVPMIINLLGHI